MRRMNGRVWLRPAERTVRVQAGMRWRDLQDRLDPHGLAVKTMRRYSNFSVGGSVSVNCRGRYVGHGPVEPACPDVERLRRIKRDADPAGRFSNELWRKYL
jgi:FAD/FMN-containing dehydrogenase